MLNFNLLTLFPSMFPGFLSQSLSGKALDKKLWSYQTINIRDFAEGLHKSVDDTPYGGGAGMIMRADIIEKALLSIKDPGKKVYLSPRGRPLNQNMVSQLSQCHQITLLCGRYEGIDERIITAHEFEEISAGDIVLSGGEPAALLLMDACIRLIPGVMGNEQTISEESFSDGLLEYPHYTRPYEWTDSHGRLHKVPEILKSGDHQKIASWRRQKSEQITKKRRPDLLS